jgi:hypothetical protein
MAGAAEHHLGQSPQHIRGMLSAPPALTQALNRDREMRRLAGEANGGIAGRPEGPGIPPAPALRRPSPLKPSPPMGQGEV